MRAGLAFLVAAYVLSQFYRAFLAVLAPVLGAELGIGAGDLALASSVWFGVFAAMQIPIGIALDRVGPRRTAGWLHLIGGGGGAVLLASAQSPGAVIGAMALLGVGCAPVLMAGLYIFARTYPVAVFGSLAGAMLGVGSAGNLASSAPFAILAEALGWRVSVGLLAGVTIGVAAGILAFVRDPAPVEAPVSGDGTGLKAVLRQRALWVLVPLMVVNYAPAAGIRGLWAGPYLGETYELGPGGIGVVTFWMAAAMIAGNLAYGPLERLAGTRKWVIVGGNALGAGCLLALGLVDLPGVRAAVWLLAGVGFFGASFPLVIAHARSYFPPHLVGRAVTLVNLMTIGGVSLLQFASGRVHGAVVAQGGAGAAPFQAIFVMFGCLVLIGCAVYAAAQDRLD